MVARCNIAKQFKTIVGVVSLMGLSAAPQAQGLHDVPVPADMPETLTAIIEIPAGTNVKYEIDKQGRIFVDRFMAMPVAYPVNYGSIAGTRGPDGDPVDVLVYTRAPIIPGALINVRPIGVLRMVDRGQPDQKIVAVPMSKMDATYDSVLSMADLPAIERERLVAFFRVYKQLPAGAQTVEVSGFGDAAEAKALLQTRLARK